MAIYWVRLSHQLFTVLILNAVLVVLVPFPFGVLGGMWNSILSAPDHCLFVYFSQSTQAQCRRRLLKNGPAMGRRKRSSSAEGTRRESTRGGFSPDCSTFCLCKQPCIHDNTRGRLPHRNVTTFYFRIMKTENVFSLGFSDQRGVVEIQTF